MVITAGAITEATTDAMVLIGWEVVIQPTLHRIILMVDTMSNVGMVNMGREGHPQDMRLMDRLGIAANTRLHKDLTLNNPMEVIHQKQEGKRQAGDPIHRHILLLIVDSIHQGLCLLSTISVRHQVIKIHVFLLTIHLVTVTLPEPFLPPSRAALQKKRHMAWGHKN